MKRLIIIANVVFVMALALPLVQQLTGVFPDAPLAGVEQAPAPPVWRPGAWWDGSLQAAFDPWFNFKVGWRGVMVRTANQLNYSLFGELVQRSGTKVLVGRDQVLYEKVYVDAFNQAGTRPERELRDISAAVRHLQDLLAAKGIAFLLVIAPSKAEIYPEFLPPKVDVAGRAARRSNYQNMIGVLEADGVNLLDAHRLFLEWKQAGAPMLFAKGGTHWNQYAASRMVQLLTERLRNLTGQDLPGFTVTGCTTNDVIVGADNDLGELLNLWTSHRFAGPQLQPRLERRAGTYLPDILFIGDSFVFTLTDIMDREKLYRRRDLFYYYQRRFNYPNGGDVPLDKRQLDLLQELEGRDALVIEVGEYWLPRIGFGIVRDLLKALDR